jgi:hypothetical protein
LKISSDGQMRCSSLPPAPIESGTSGSSAMTDKIAYYAMFDEDSSRDRPRTVLRRLESSQGKTDEVFSRDLRWEASPLLHRAEHGDITNDFTEITEAEAEQILARIRASAVDEM